MEPMTLGSPVSSPGSNQGQYLPPFLMCDGQTMTPHNNTLSPKLGRYSVSFATSPGSNTPQETSYSNPQAFNRSGLIANRSLFAGCSGGTPAGRTNNSHQAGPPTQGLFDTLRTEQVSTAAAGAATATTTPNMQQRNHLAMLQTSQLNSTNYSLNQSGHPPTTQLNDSYVSSAPNAVNASMRALCSPLGATMSPQARGAEFWVTIFGFSPGASSMILHHFAMCGTIEDVVNAPQNGNWMHVRFGSRIECGKALNYNQKIIASNVMVGVTRCTDDTIIDKGNARLLGAEGTPAPPYRPKVRPLAQESYNNAQYDSQVSPNRNNVPQKSSGLMNKAMDLFFGW
ncbi:nucleoporin Nup35 [Drosophila grimshawi]|uniref:Nucleoporin NUP53 n=1 Tax=Drosophila grimshawi TaxID=7222 RepID=B4JL90_DROGR|nr:nucleoporin Nup35 [Drosophila grimshawi]EDW00343.1 GH11910 [Drosophila grimshawi]